MCATLLITYFDSNLVYILIKQYIDFCYSRHSKQLENVSKMTVWLQVINFKK